MVVVVAAHSVVSDMVPDLEYILASVVAARMTTYLQKGPYLGQGDQASCIDRSYPAEDRYKLGLPQRMIELGSAGNSVAGLDIHIAILETMIPANMAMKMALGKIVAEAV